MASIACSMNVTRGSGTSVCGSVLGVNSGSGSTFVVLDIWKPNPDGPRKVPRHPYTAIASVRRHTSHPLTPIGIPVDRCPMPKITAKQRAALLRTLQARFEAHGQRHVRLDWPSVQARVESNHAKLWS